VEKVIRCDCGFEARAPHEDALVAEVRRHAWDAYGMPLSEHEALLLVFRSELDRIRVTGTGPSENEET
jgi:hypothetical protein